MTYTVAIHKDSDSGFWCASKHYEDGTIGENYAFATSPSAVQYKLENEEGEESEDIIFDGE